MAGKSIGKVAEDVGEMFTFSKEAIEGAVFSRDEPVDSAGYVIDDPTHPSILSFR
jgi:hypothetical protein